MKNTIAFKPAICSLGICAALALFMTGCASPDEHSYNKDFGESLPAQPIYSIQNEDADHFILKVHQGVPLNGAGRTINVKEAASGVAKAEAERLGWKKWELNYIQEKDQGWMHVVVAKVDRKPYSEPTFGAPTGNP
ncbi:MAG TPA: hypothetical protein VG347_13045 [Verrucomicrobiae bacterium]|nr:hypothetical protein [Verrucomicrobiae bacterium]